VGEEAVGVHYSVNRFTVRTPLKHSELVSRFEAAVPPVPADRIRPLVERHAPWQEMLDVIESSAPLGFLIYHRYASDPVMQLAGDDGTCVSYLMGNHTIAERMFRFEPAILLYAPLHVAIWAYGEGDACLSFDRPSDQFGSFDNPDITKVGEELDAKVAALLAYLNLPMPDGLKSA
jgi:Domain of unknown function DUF302